MYSVVFETDNGKKFIFGRENGNVFDMDLGKSVSVDIGTSQGFGQIGETVQTQAVGSRLITVKGVIYENISKQRKNIRNICAPFTSGRLIFQNEYEINVYVKDPPSFSIVKNDGRYSMSFFAPYPYFSSIREEKRTIGAIEPMFHFPINYSAPHKFGEKGAARYTNIYNAGDVKIPFSVTIIASGTSTNVTITNLHTLEFLKLNGTLSVGDKVKIYKDKNNILRAELTANGTTSDIISWIDEDSSLFELSVGDNLINADDEEGGNSVEVFLDYKKAVVAVYED